jgi:hypothetical protein
LSFTEKVDVLDLLINILREHEEKLDALVGRMEAMCGGCPALGVEEVHRGAEETRPVR